MSRIVKGAEAAAAWDGGGAGRGDGRGGGGVWAPHVLRGLAQQIFARGRCQVAAGCCGRLSLAASVDKWTQIARVALHRCFFRADELTQEEGQILNIQIHTPKTMRRLCFVSKKMTDLRR
jgi:hypothetical protein